MLRALTNLTIPAQTSPQGSPYPCPWPSSPLQPVSARPRAMGPCHRSADFQLPTALPWRFTPGASPTCWLMSWCSLKLASSPPACLTTWAEPSFPPSLSLPCSPQGRWDWFLAGTSCWLDHPLSILPWLPPDRYYAMLAWLWEKGSLGEEQSANASPGSSWRLEPPEHSEVLVLQLDQETLSSPGLS